ncbi:MAG: ABC transporter permease [Gammaproteobacteria bacterium]|nr:ABC transporter permease [Gammaproteobacteria bacterium]
MRRLRQIVWLGLKEIVSLRRDAVMLGLLIYSFSIAIVIEATGTSTSVNNASIAFVDEDRSMLSRRLANAFFPPEFQPPVLLEAERIDAAMDAGHFLFIVVVPPSFEADLRNARTPAVQVLVDATAMEQAGIGHSYITNILTTEIDRFALRRDRESRQAVELVTHSAFNPNRDTVRFQSIVSLISHLTTMTMVLTGAAVMRERERGTIEHLLAMPLSPFDIAVSKILANSAIVLMVAMLSMLLIVEGMLGVEIAGSRLLFLLAASLYVFSAAALGVFLATIAQSMAQFALLAILTIMAILFLSGGETPVEGQPIWLQHMTLLLASRHFISASQAIIFKGAGLASIWMELLGIVVLGIALLAGSLAMFRRAVAADR